MEIRPKIVFLGTPGFGVPALEALVNAGYQIVGVITAPDKPVGRKQILTPPPVKSFILEHESWNIKIYQSENRTELLEIMENLRPDLAIVAAFGMIFTKEILEIPKYGFLNIHASLLPRWRGASPIQSAILAGDEKTGATIILINEKMDEGPILASRELEFSRLRQGFGGQVIFELTCKELGEALSELGAELLIETIPKWVNGEIKPREQEHEKATYCKKITKEDGLIDLEKEPPEIIGRKIRAFTPWPGAYTFINGKHLIITRVELNKNPSTSLGTSNAFKIKRVKPEGKKEMNFADYLRGNPNEFLKKFL